jgi:hypothetical protein
MKPGRGAAGMLVWDVVVTDPTVSSMAASFFEDLISLAQQYRDRVCI